MGESANNIGKFLKAKREAAGYSQERLAKACSLKHDSLINRIENGTRKVSWEELCEIAKVLDNFHVFDVLVEAGYITEQDINPVLKLRRLDRLNENELGDVQDYIDFLIYKRNAESQAGRS